jgi:phage terminase small subunit
MTVKAKKLTTKQQRFVDFYDGNATDAAREAGYKGNSVTLGQVGQENLKKPLVAKALASREKKRNKSTIATREERQAFWSRVYRGQEKNKIITKEGVEIECAPSMKDRLKATELLGKSEADFVERHREEGELTIKIVKYTDIAKCQK